MKYLKDGTRVPSRMWYYILDFLSQEQAEAGYPTVRASELTRSEFYRLFQEATIVDMETV